MHTQSLVRPSAPVSVSTLRVLGLAALLGSPAMLIEVYRHGLQRVANEDTDPLGALLYGLFSVGWLCAMIGLRHLHAAGYGKVGRALMNVVVVTVTLAIGQSVMDLLRVPTSHPLYMVTDLAWPLSMVLTFAVSVAALFARVLPLWGRLVLVFCGISLPINILVMVLTGDMIGGASFAWHTFLGWAGLGLVLLLARPGSEQFPAQA
ncbi:hypothetical protein DAETH_39400 (plasmid) [Deinococcus aetherius]|uniref:Uncharacterized protein n=1 Tax=Deinococcus aetherius TaxID=200252 RepID=A0ABN6RNQ7_9DEIO|nr:hypothetical protein [Deinococcus aetherius]BDP43971.1 hypothetical protein DAETH_39400 [Deinococcus aetherius]